MLGFSYSKDGPIRKWRRGNLHFEVVRWNHELNPSTPVELAYHDYNPDSLIGGKQRTRQFVISFKRTDISIYYQSKATKESKREEPDRLA